MKLSLFLALLLDSLLIDYKTVTWITPGMLGTKVPQQGRNPGFRR